MNKLRLLETMLSSTDAPSKLRFIFSDGGGGSGPSIDRFVFADLYGFSDMYLIHSTKQGELSDPNWRRKVETF